MPTFLPTPIIGCRLIDGADTIGYVVFHARHASLQVMTPLTVDYEIPTHASTRRFAVAIDRSI